MARHPDDVYQRGAAALLPFVSAYGLPLSPEDLDLMAWAVLEHAFSDQTYEEIHDAVQEAIDDHIQIWQRLPPQDGE